MPEDQHRVGEYLLAGFDSRVAKAHSKIYEWRITHDD